MTGNYPAGLHDADWKHIFGEDCEEPCDFDLEEARGEYRYDCMAQDV